MAETLDPVLTADLASSASWGIRPDARDDWAKTDEDHPSNAIKVLANDRGAYGVVQVDGKSITAGSTVVLEDSKAEVTLNKDGTLTYDPSGQFEKLNNGETGEDTFAYTVTGKGKATDTATVNVTIAGVTDPVDPGENDAPVANDDKAYLPNYYPYPGPVPLPYEEAATTTDGSVSDGPIMTTLAIGEEGDPNPYPSSVNINVLANDTDPDNGDTLTVTKIDGKDVKSGDTVTLEDSLATVTLNGDGSLTYTENAKYVDSMLTASSDGSGELLPYPGPVVVDSFTYSASDGSLSDEANVEVYRMSDGYVLSSEPAA